MKPPLERRVIPLIGIKDTQLERSDVKLDTSHALANEQMVRLEDYGIRYRLFYPNSGNAPLNEPVAGYIECAWVRRSIAEKLKAVNQRLEAYGMTLLVLDAYRDHDCQKALWKSFMAFAREEKPGAGEEVLTDFLKLYIAYPTEIDSDNANSYSPHMTDGAVDAMLIYLEDQTPVNLGSAFSDMSDLSLSNYFEHQLIENKIAADDKRLLHRRILYHAMLEQDLINSPNVFWHYEWGDVDYIRRRNILFSDTDARAWYGPVFLER